MKPEKDPLRTTVGLGAQDLMDNAAWKSARIGFASTAASQVTVLMRPSALDAMHSAVLRASPVQELAASVAVGLRAQPALSAISILAERISPAQELVTSMSRLAVGIAGQPVLLATSTLAERLAPAQELVERVSRLTTLFAPSPALGLMSTLAERMSSSVLNRRPDRTRAAHGDAGRPSAPQREPQ